MHSMTGETSDLVPEIEGEPTRRNWFSFWSLFTLQTQNAFNDKAAQFLLIPLGGVLMASIPGAGGLEYMLGALIVLPFILFAPIAGWISDRYSKTSVIRGAIILQFIVLAWIGLAVLQRNLWMAVAGFFMLSVESVILSPAKRGIVKELVGHSRLGFASGVLEMSVVLAVCAGQILSGWWFDIRLGGFEEILPGSIENGWNAAFFPLVLIAAGALPTIAISYGIEKIPAMGSRRFEKKIFWEHFGQLKDLWEDRRIRLSAAGAAFFWGFAGFLNLAAIQMGKDMTGGGYGFGTDIAVLMLAASGGITLGGVIASLICKKNIELGLVPVGGMIMVIGSLALAMTPISSVWIKIWLMVAGAGGAILLVPLNAYLQDVCPPEKRGRIIAGLNLLDCIAGLIAVVLQGVLAKTGAPYWVQFSILAVIALWATSYSARILPQHVVRIFVLGLFKIFYRVRVLNADRIPKEGGVLLTPNHVSYVDAFILSCASTRKVRFLMFDGYFSHPWIGKFVRLFDTVPISQTRAKEALRVAAEALNEGHMVCIFPEGQLTRTGCMNEFKRGFEMIARKAKCPVLPAAMDGLWGSIFSFERKKFIYKIPYRIRYGVTVNFGELIEPDEVDAVETRNKVASLRADAFLQRLPMENPMKVIGNSVNILAAPADVLDEYHISINTLRERPLAEQKRIAANAIQVGDVNAIGRGQTVIIEWSGLENCREVMTIAFAQYFDLKLVLVDSSVTGDEVRKLTEQHHVQQYIGGNALAEACLQAGMERVCYNFSSEAVTNTHSLPCLAVKQRVVSMSMPHPVAITATNLHQEGYREGTWGRLLPAYHLKSETNQISLSGASVEGILEVAGVRVEIQGFVEQTLLTVDEG
ncbi:MFS transporter [Oceaniferula spumae]